MGEKAVVESQVTDAIALIKSLDSDGAAPTLTVWYFYDDAAEWRLIIAGPAFDALLPKQEAIAYRKIVEAMAVSSLSSLTISDLKLVRTDSALPLALRSLVGTAPGGVVRAHFTDTSLMGIFIKEMIVLRSAQSASPRAA
jgi:hypothetical protein